MSKYSQLPRDTLALLAMRAQKGVAAQDYVNWAVNALVEGFDSPSLAVLAGLGYDTTSQIEAPDYFLRTVKELALPIPDCELAIGNWYSTDSFYRKLGLSLPDEKTLLSQHLEELAEQIKEGVIDPVAGLDRIYHEVVAVYRLGLWESDTLNFKEGWDGIDGREWDDLWSFVHYDENYNEEDEPARKSEEIITFAKVWLENPKERRIRKTATREPTIIQHEMIEPLREQPNIEKGKPISVQYISEKTERTPTYRNDKYGFTLDLPIGWTISSGVSRIPFILSNVINRANILEEFSLDNKEYLNIVVEQMQPEFPPDINELMFALQAQEMNYTDLQFGRITIGGRDHAWVCYVMTGKGWLKKYMIVLNGYGYALTASCPLEHRSPVVEKTWDGIAASFRLLRPIDNSGTTLNTSPQARRSIELLREKLKTQLEERKHQ